MFSDSVVLSFVLFTYCAAGFNFSFLQVLKVANNHSPHRRCGFSPSFFGNNKKQNKKKKITGGKLPDNQFSATTPGWRGSVNSGKSGKFEKANPNSRNTCDTERCDLSHGIIQLYTALPNTIRFVFGLCRRRLLACVTTRAEDGAEACGRLVAIVPRLVRGRRCWAMLIALQATLVHWHCLCVCVCVWISACQRDIDPCARDLFCVVNRTRQWQSAFGEETRVLLDSWIRKRSKLVLVAGQRAARRPRETKGCTPLRFLHPAPIATNRLRCQINRLDWALKRRSSVRSR